MNKDDEFKDYFDALDKGIDIVYKCIVTVEQMNKNHMEIERKYMRINFMVIIFYIIATIILFLSCCNLV